MLAEGRDDPPALEVTRIKKPSRFVAVVVAVGAVLFGATVPASAADPTPAISVTLTTENSGQLGPNEPLRALVTIGNPTPTATAPATATVSVDPLPLTTRDAISEWLSGTTKSSVASRTVAHTPVPSVGSQLSGAVSAIAPESTLGIRTAGVYGVYVSVASGATVLGTARTAIAWNMASTPSVPVAIAVPITVPSGDAGFLTAAELTQYTAQNGVLTRELAAIQDSQIAIAIGIDPRIVASIRVLGDSAPATAQEWLKELAALPNESFPLAWADADVTAPLHAGASAVLAPKSLAYAINPKLFPATNDSTPTPTPTPGSEGGAVPTPADLVAWNYSMPELAWPTDDSVEPGDLAKLNAAGIKSLILTTKNVDASKSNGLTGASGTSASTRIAVSDDVLSGYLRAAVAATTRVASTEALDDLTTTLALISQKSGGHPRTILLSLDRNWSTEDASFARGIDGLYAHPWVSAAVLSSVFAESPTTLTLDKDGESAERIALVANMLQAEARLARFSVIAADPATITSSYRLQLLALLSNEWENSPAAWTRAATKWITGTDGVVTSVQVAHSGHALALADRVALPITISNGLDQAVTVTLLARSTTTKFAVEPRYQSQTITIDADSQKKVQIPIDAVGKGNGHLVVSLRSADGLPIGRDVTLTINVQAGWETLGTLIFAALIVALFAFGIIRRFRKRRTENDDDDSLDTEPATDSGSGE
jgi:hypothetical protein